MFVLVGNSLGFARAARALGVTASTVSKAVARLELQLGAKLLVRTTRSVRLTEAGRALLERASRVVEEMDAMERGIAALGSAPRGRLRLELPLTLGARQVVPRLARFCAAHPHVELDVRLDDRYVDLVGEGSDAAVRVGELVDSRLVARRLRSARVVTVAAPTFVRRQASLRRPEQLPSDQCLGFRSARSGRILPWSFTRQGRVQSFAPNVVHVFSNSEALVAAATAGLGAAQVLDFAVAGELADGRLVQLFPELSSAGPPISFVCPPEHVALPKVRALSDFLAAELSGRLRSLERRGRGAAKDS